jgi:dihydrolipoamide dehydrogenase
MGGEMIVIEKSALGGTCLNHGCIPTKAILSSLDVLRTAREGRRYGLQIENVSFNWPQIIKRKEQITSQLRQGIAYLFRKRRVQLIVGEGKVLGEKLIEVKKESGEIEKIEVDKIVLAQGSRPLLPPFIPSHPSILTSQELLALTEIPKSLLILGGGAIGVEFACIFAELGIPVTIVEMMSQLLPEIDEEIVGVLTEQLKKKMKIFTSTKVEKISIDENNSVKAETNQGEILEAEKMLVALGRQPNLEEIENLNLEKKDGGIKVNQKMETSLEGIYAIGDLTGAPFLAHKASVEGIVAVQNILGKETRMNYHHLPACIFSHPEIATVGVTEKEAREKNIAFLTGRFPFRAVGKAVAMGEFTGLVKIVAEKETDKILGAQIIGPQASTLIHELVLAIKMGLKTEEVAETIHAHPTLSEGIGEACEAIWGRQINYV